VALRELLVERFRGVRSARLSFEPTTVLVGENDSGKSSLLEALALVLSPLAANPPLFQDWHFHREVPGAGSRPAGDIRIQVTLEETTPGSWSRPGLEALAPVLGRGTGAPRTLVVELGASFAEGSQTAPARWEIRRAGGGRSRNDPEALAAVRRLNPLVWFRGWALAHPAGFCPPQGAEAHSDQAALLASYERLLTGATSSPLEELAHGHALAERLLAGWAPGAAVRAVAPRASVAEIFGGSAPPSAQHAALPATTAQKLGLLLLTARVFEHLRDAAVPGVRPTMVVEEPEAGLHPTTLASVWGLLEQVPSQKIVTTHSGSLLSAAPLRSLRRIARAPDGVVREWRVSPGALKKDELRKVGYHLRARRGVACFARCWLLVEGETEFWILPDLARLLGYDLSQEGVVCVEFAQCGLRPLVKLARALGIEWHVLADGDPAGQEYAAVARSLLRGDAEALRVSALAERDIEHCFWRHGHAAVFERLAGAGPGSAPASPRRVIEKAVERRTKPGVAFELLAAVAAAGGRSSAPPPLVRAIETCVALARGAAIVAGSPAPGGAA
jgi:putative ATP-dependent endonuclease of OLD family